MIRKAKRLGDYVLTSMATEAVLAKYPNFFRSRNSKLMVLGILEQGLRVNMGDRKLAVVCGNLVDDVTDYPQEAGND